MRNRLLALTAALAVAVLASWTPSAAATSYLQRGVLHREARGHRLPLPPGDRQGRQAEHLRRVELDHRHRLLVRVGAGRNP